MEPSDLTIEILKAIRDEGRQTNQRLSQTNERLDDVRAELKAELAQTRTELGERIDTLARRVVESEVRTSTAITDMHGTLHEVADLLRAQHDLRPRVDRCEQDIAGIKGRLGIG